MPKGILAAKTREAIVNDSEALRAIVVEYGWGQHEEELLAAVRWTEIDLENTLADAKTSLQRFRVLEIAPFAEHAREARSVLVVAKLLCAGVSPYEGLTQEEWQDRAERETDRYLWARDQAAFWQKRKRKIEASLTG